MIAGFLWGAPWRQGEALRIIRAIQRSILVAGLGLFAILALFPDAVASRFAIYAETLSPSSTASELLVRTRDYPLSNFLATFDYPNWPYGYGIGTASLGIQYVARIFHATPMRIGVENGFGQIILELGVVGLLLWIVLGVSISISSWKVANSLKGTPWFPISFAIFLFAFLLVLPMTYYGFIEYQNYILNAYLWLLLGILFRLQTMPEAVRLAETEKNLGTSNRSNRLRLAVVSPFLDRQHGTELCLVEQIERLASRDHWQIHLYSQRVEQVEGVRPAKKPFDRHGEGIFWQEISDIPGPHLLKYGWWFIANQWRRKRDRRSGEVIVDLVYSPASIVWTPT